jgi:hypothetical protein
VKTGLARALGVIAAVSLGGAAAAPPAWAGPSAGTGPSADARTARPAAVTSPGHASVQPWPITITIRTVPSLPGVRFVFDGAPIVTGSRGSTSVTQQHNFSAHTLTLAQTQVSASDRRYTFVRWAGQRDPNQAFRATVQGLPMRADYTVTASFAVMCPVSPRLAQQNGAALPAARVSQITLRNNLGQPATLRPSGTTWLPCAWPVYRGSLLSSTDLQYSVQSMLVSGTNTVHVGVERFTPNRTPNPKLTGYFYSLTITAHDAIFGNALGSYALLTMPDGTVRRVPLGPRHVATVSNLPQGNYQVEIKARGASVPAQTLRLSKDQTASLAAVSRGDIAVVGGALLAGLAGIPLLSRTRRRRIFAFLRHPARSRRRAATEEA